MLRKLKKGKRGFTLVELIVVLIILGILAAMLLPTLTGYIEKAREERVMTEARNIALAGQTSYASYYANRVETPTGRIEDKKDFIASFFKKQLQSDFGITYSSARTLRSTAVKNGNAYAIETGLMKRANANQLIANVKSGTLGANCVEYYVKQTTFDSLVGFNYVSEDKKYLVTLIIEPQNTQDYKDVSPWTYIIQKIE